MNDLQQHHIEYLFDQLVDDNDLGITMCLQHITGQELLKQPRNWQPSKDVAVQKLGLATLVFTAIHWLYVALFPSIISSTISIAAATTIFLVGCTSQIYIKHRRVVPAINWAIGIFVFMALSLITPLINNISPQAILVLFAAPFALGTSTVGVVYALNKAS